jgi:hypothetical protein
VSISGKPVRDQQKQKRVQPAWQYTCTTGDTMKIREEERNLKKYLTL